ncbi:unnamed protein product [Lampetra planeri]
MEVTGRRRKRKSPSSKLRKSNAFAEENSAASDLEYPMQQEKHVAVDSEASRCLALDEAMANGSGRVHVFPSGDGTEEGSINNGNSHQRTISSQPSAHPSKADASRQQSRADQDLTAMSGIPAQPNPNDIKTEPEEDNQSAVLWENPEDNNGLHLSTTDDVEFHQLSMLESLAGHWNDDGSRNQHLIPQSFTNSSTGIASSPRENSDREAVCDTHDLSMHRCKCSCEPLLHSILHELKSIRELMQSQTGGAPGTACRLPDTQCRQASRIRIENVKTLVMAAAAGPMAGPAGLMAQGGRKAVPAGKHTILSRAEQGTSRSVDSMERPGPNSAGLATSTPISTLAVQLADGYNVFMARSQLEEILMHYTRSGSLLFRKLVAAFFDDHTLANSLPNGKRKRGFNDPRKGLEPNIVAAIRSFTESYCENKKIMKLPGPKDWVQLLQDQIKLARRRIRRVPAHNMRLQDAAEAFKEDKVKLE